MGNYVRVENLYTYTIHAYASIQSWRLGASSFINIPILLNADALACIVLKCSKAFMTLFIKFPNNFLQCKLFVYPERQFGLVGTSFQKVLRVLGEKPGRVSSFISVSILSDADAFAGIVLKGPQEHFDK